MTRRTPLFDLHKALGGRLIAFAGWEMPVQYSGVLEEHLAVRQKAGLFDVSHMGEIEIRGPHALDLVQKVTCNDASTLSPGRSQYSALLTPQGTFVDDIMVYRLSNDHFLLCVNASNREKDLNWIQSHALPEAEVTDTSDRWALLALQGPLAREILPSPLKKTRFESTTLFGSSVLLSCTGYTGEDGFEIFCPWDEAPKLWTRLLDEGRANGLLPCGLGARDTLRLEAGYPLYGHEIDTETNPYEAGLAWILKMEKGGFIGREALQTAAQRPPRRFRLGVTMKGQEIPRQGYPVIDDEGEAGRVTSGSFSPLLGKGIAMGYSTRDLTKPSNQEKKVWIMIRGQKRDAVIQSLPFYQRKP